jgi:hypothetical protein
VGRVPSPAAGPQTGLPPEAADEGVAHGPGTRPTVPAE